MPAVSLDGVTKRFGDAVALRDVDLVVAEGEVFGLVGPNGSGKSTVLNLLVNFIRPTAGRVAVFDRDVAGAGVSTRRRIGVVPEGYAVYDRLTGREHVSFVVDSKAAAVDPDAILDRVGLADVADRAAGGYSSGMKKRLLLGMALVDEPDLLLLDEPFRGLDPAAVVTLREALREENDRGATVVFSSHLVAQLEAVCDRVALLLDGELVAQGGLSDLRARADATTLRLTVDGGLDGATDALRGIDGVVAVDVDPAANEIAVTCGDRAKAAVVSRLDAAGVTVLDLTTDELAFEELFLAHRSEAGP